VVAAAGHFNLGVLVVAGSLLRVAAGGDLFPALGHFGILAHCGAVVVVLADHFEVRRRNQQRIDWWQDQRCGGLDMGVGRIRPADIAIESKLF
jgi:hypothetical protein